MMRASPITQAHEALSVSSSYDQSFGSELSQQLEYWFYQVPHCFRFASSLTS